MDQLLMDEVFELIDAIKATDIYQIYLASLKVFDDPKIKALIRQKETLNEIYLNYQQAEDLKQLKRIKVQLAQIPEIQYYQQQLKQLDDLLFEINQMMFSDISSHLKIQRYHL